MLTPSSFDLRQYLSAPDAALKPESPDEYRQLVVDLFYGDGGQRGDYLPWMKTQDLFRLRKKEVTVWCGPNGHGKSAVTSQVALHLAVHGGQKVAIASMEMAPERTLWRMVRQACGNHQPTIRYIDTFLKAMAGRIWILPVMGQTDPKTMLAASRYAVDKLGCTHVVIDSMMKVVKGEDDYNGQKDFVDSCCAAARDLDIHMHLIHHTKKLADEHQKPGKYDGKGSGSISDQVDNWVTVFRNKRKEEALRKDPTDAKWIDSPDTILGLEKQRNGEWEGHMALWYDMGAMSYRGDKRERPLTIGMDELEQLSAGAVPEMKAPVVTDEDW